MTVIKGFQEKVEAALQELAVGKQPMGLYDPVGYILSLGGKRIRPALCLTACSMFNAEEAVRCLNPALALEVFHNFTLLHDDIMDGSPMRRNHPTVHMRWNNNTAILSGDAMLIMAYQLMANTPEALLGPVLEEFSKTALEVCEGQQMDMDFESRMDVTESEYLEMIRLKTAVLLGASLKIGARIGGADATMAESLYKFGSNIGISFQLQDDWLDVFGDEAVFGKSIGGDIVCNKKTYLLITAQNHLNGQSKKELNRWLLKKEFDRDEKIAAVRNLYAEANVSGKARAMMDYYYHNAIRQLDLVSGSTEIREELRGFARQLMERTR
jgi:geranylgeranyl diphosphate synthase, type II